MVAGAAGARCLRPQGAVLRRSPLLPVCCRVLAAAAVSLLSGAPATEKGLVHGLGEPGAFDSHSVGGPSVKCFIGASLLTPGAEVCSLSLFFVLQATTRRAGCCGTTAATARRRRRCRAPPRRWAGWAWPSGRTGCRGGAGAPPWRPSPRASPRRRAATRASSSSRATTGGRSTRGESATQTSRHGIQKTIIISCLTLTQCWCPYAGAVQRRGGVGRGRVLAVLRRGGPQCRGHPAPGAGAVAGRARGRRDRRPAAWRHLHPPTFFIPPPFVPFSPISPSS